jgi:hypothetical protein
LHGEEEKDKASILVVGEDLDQNIIREKTNEIKEKYKFNIIYLVVTKCNMNKCFQWDYTAEEKLFLYNS